MESEEQIKLLFALVDSKRIHQLEEEIRELRGRLNQDNNNSSKPPSSDSIFKKSDRLSRSKKSKRKPGGQLVHKGNKLTKFSQVDFHIDHSLRCCPCCQSKELRLLKTCTKQVVPIPKMVITENTLYDYTCQKSL